MKAQNQIIVEAVTNEVRSIAMSLDDSCYRMVETSRNMRALVDAKHYETVTRYKWFAVITSGNHVYPVADISGKRISLQRYVYWLENQSNDLTETKQVSCLNKVTFDCRSENLTRSASRSTSMQNRRPKRNTSSQYKGVVRAERTDGNIVWRTQIKGALGSMTLGTFEDEQVAAEHYDAAAYIFFPDSGYYNFPDTAPKLEALEHVRIMIERRKQRMKRRGEKSA